MVIDNIVLLKPYFLLCVFLPLLLVFFKSNKREASSAVFLPHLDSLLKLRKSIPSFFNIKKIIFFLSFFSLAIALSEPNLTSSYKKNNSYGYDLMLVIDASGSMQALDFSTESKLLTRLDVTKNVIHKFLGKRVSDRIGVIVFGSHAYIDSPLTVDNVSLQANIANIETGIAGEATAIGDALALAVGKLHEKKDNSRAIILLTDGENTGGVDPFISANLAKKYKIPVYTVGIGSNQEAPFVNGLGQVFHAKVTLDVHSLKKIAEISGGKFFNAKNTSELTKIYDEINSLTPTKSDVEIIKEYNPIYRYFIYVALLLLILLRLPWII